jgi:hypothetical protein
LVWQSLGTIQTGSFIALIWRVIGYPTAQTRL